MSPKYLVGSAEDQFGERSFKLVEAANEQQAMHKYVERLGIHEEIFKEHVYGRSVNMSFAEHFWIQSTEEEEALFESGSVKIDEGEFQERVRRFFGAHNDFASLYLEYYSDESDNATGSFPEEMLVYIWENSEWSHLSAVSVAEIEVL